MIRLPILVSEPNEIYVFTNREYAERYLEAIDVRDGRYTAYDSSGRLLRFSVQVVNKREVVRIEAAEPEPTHQKQLRNHLVAFFSAISLEQLQWEQLSLEALVEISLKYKTDYFRGYASREVSEVRRMAWLPHCADPLQFLLSQPHC